MFKDKIAEDLFYYLADIYLGYFTTIYLYQYYGEQINELPNK